MRFNLINDQELKIKIYNLLGEQVFYKEKLYYRGNNTVQLSSFLEDNKSGFYFIEVSSKYYYGKDIIIISK